MNVLVFAALSLVIRPPASLDASITDIARRASGRVGVAVSLLETGETVSVHGNDRYPMQSVYKLPIAMAVLDLVDRGHFSLTRRVVVRRSDLVRAPIHSPLRERFPNGPVPLTIEDLVIAALIESDGTASDILMRLAGGPGRVTAYLRRLGVRDIVVATTERAMGRDEQVQYRNFATPNALLRLLTLIHRRRVLALRTRTFLLACMRSTGTGPRRIRGQLPAGTPVAHKTGSSRTIGGLTRATNDAGIVTLPDGRHMAVVVFVSDSRASEAERDAAIARVAKTAWDYWTHNAVQ